MNALTTRSLHRKKNRRDCQRVITQAVVLIAVLNRNNSGNRFGTVTVHRTRRSVEEIYSCLGDYYFNRAYRMTYQSFWRLHSMLRIGIKTALDEARQYVLKGGRQGGNFSPPPIPNGNLSTSVRLALCLRYSCGGSPYDLMCKYGVSHTAIFNSVWCVVEAVNKCLNLMISYPSSHEEQERIAAGFQAKSSVGFAACAGAIDGILIWMNKPCLDDAQLSDVGRLKYLCGRKKKFGLNCQAVSDVEGRMLDISLGYGGATSDCMAFEGSTLFHKLEGGMLRDGLCLFGDNAYINSKFMATPYPNVSNNTRDDYNYFQSQLRIRVECAFGMWVMRWGILRTAMPMNITIQKTIAFVHALAKLHNFCIDERRGNDTVDNIILQNPLHSDTLHIMENENGYTPITTTANHDVAVPLGLMNIGNNTGDGIPRSLRQQQERNEIRMAGGVERLPRHSLHLQVIAQHGTRPTTHRR